MANKDNTIITFFKSIGPGQIIVILVLVVGFIVNQAVFQANASAQTNQISEKVKGTEKNIEDNELKIENNELKIEENELKIIKNRHTTDLILQKQDQVLEIIKEIKENLKK